MRAYLLPPQPLQALSFPRSPDAAPHVPASCPIVGSSSPGAFHGVSIPHVLPNLSRHILPRGLPQGGAKSHESTWRRASGEAMRSEAKGR